MNEPLVFLPGMMCDASLFAPQLRDLSVDHAVMVAPITQGERIEEIASNVLMLAPQRFALAGVSMGGIVAMEILRRAPERVTRVALMDTNPLAETPKSAAGYEPLIVGARAGRLGEVLQMIMHPDYLAPGPKKAEVLAQVAEMGQRIGAEVFVRQVRALQRRRDYQATLRKCKVPALILCGEHDGLTPVKRHSFMAELMHDAELSIIADAGHLPVLEQGEAVNVALRGWLGRPFVLRQ